MPDDVAADKLAVLECLSDYCYAIDFLDCDALGDLFTEDAVLHFSLGGVGREDITVSGGTAIGDYFRDVLPQFGAAAPKHPLTNHVVRVDGTRASSRSYLATGAGLYAGEYERSATGWRLSRLTVTYFARPTRGSR
jgi:hypothetical protein